ncbi:transglutaminase family protein [Burkholderia singularis]|uniref:Large protein containing transglutaminase-like domain n=1 Tax=Burkholderia singularis TaxID=1503053 RepID=A0A238H195_9BURK|nr:transglutaminase family protein [Burkholderia singularis]SMF98986.1 Large protein containing transglutaminase-like domain [Burkholderia singularis]
MSIHVALHHVTRYRYDRAVHLGPQVVRLRPAPHCRTPILAYSMKVEPATHFANWQQDPFANYLARLVFPEKTGTFEIVVDLVAEMSVYNPFDFFLDERAQSFPFCYEDALRDELAPYLACDPPTSESTVFRSYIESIDRTPARTIDFLVALNQRLQRDIRYLVRLEPGVQTPEQTLKLASGSCRDSGWLLVQICRRLGLAARFVSGYLIQLTPDVKSLDGPSGTESDFTDLHAWCEVYLPGAGWIGLDPTSGLLAGEGHIPLAATPQPTSAAPVEGLVDECDVEFEHEMRVTRIYESPRVTKPYTDEQWQRVLSLGGRVDAALDAGDVRLTQGGEPTFVSMDDRDGAEWNTDALGPTKRGYATSLIQKLRDEYGTGGFLHFGQGKWYPGEQLPRWALSVFWRADGEPVWHDPTRFADEREPSSYTTADAERFIRALAMRIGVTSDYVTPGYEDAWYYLWRERRLPVNVDPFDARLDDELERTRLRRVFSQQLDSVIGYVLPLEPLEGNAALAGPCWQTGPWFFRDERMYLVPGDSPMGYRLPLDSLPWVSSGDYPYLVERDPFAPQSALPGAAALRARYLDRHESRGYDAARGHAAAARTVMQARTGEGAEIAGRNESCDSARYPSRFESAKWITRTALCVEVRNGLLYVFMPPMAAIEHYLDLLAAVELTAESLDMKLVLEGYPPPRDARLKMLQVTPDPGVIEVNIHPAHNFYELVQHTEFLYDAAFRSRLSSEKFMVDGRHVGTGGGNHFVLGGATPADSPFLRRPDLLASLIAYWHNHPSLSYLFSGLFIGPTSQAPRVDEARNDQVYELDIAFAEIRRNKMLHGEHMPPWLVDRVLRNLLIDVTGNTHRSEFCIDKLYSPDSATGRLGLLELRAFEMPPHARMSIVQQLLLRALVARFWRTPYTTPLTRWGTALHDRFLLPTFVKLDFDDVLTEMHDAGFEFDPAWFAPHFEFRFPLFGQIAVRGIELTLRGALEPWHVMGEEGAVGGTVRYVDSSLERLEVHLSGLNDSRYMVSVNGRALPLQPTGFAGAYVAGVRYKAWSPPSALHPTLGVHAPLVFDIVDTWMQRSLGGCQYHVVHPGGRSYDTFPVNAYEAESRRLARFVSIGHTPGAMAVEPAEASREFPCTLDLRRG